MARIGRPGLPSDRRQQVRELWKAGASISTSTAAVRRRRYRRYARSCFAMVSTAQSAVVGPIIATTASGALRARTQRSAAVDGRQWQVVQWWSVHRPLSRRALRQ